MDLLSAVYFIMACNQPVAIIVDRDVDGRTVSFSHVTGVPIDDSKKMWIMEGLVESTELNEVFEIAAEIECGTPV